jgi:hypothetical protein
MKFSLVSMRKHLIKCLSLSMHVCPESLSFRYAAGLACLMGCVYNQNDRSARDLSGCEKECNDLFMTVVPIDVEWVNADITLAAFA